MSYKKALPFLLLLQLAAIFYAPNVIGAWPTGSVPTTNLDQASDSPAAARADIKTMADKTNALITAYTEGTWTPKLWDTTQADEGATYSGAIGHYVKIGKFVWVTWRMQVLTFGTMTTTDQSYVGGLPFTVSATIESGAQCYEGVSLAFPVAGQTASARFETNSNFATLYLWDTTTQSTGLLISEHSTNGNLRCWGFYRTDT